MNVSLGGSGGATTAWPPETMNVVTKSGPLFLGAIFHWGTFGVLCTQFFIYTSGFPNDRLMLKLFSYMIFALEVAQTIFLTKSYFDIFGYGFGNPEAYDYIGSAWFSVSLLSGIVAFLTQMFYALRLHKLWDSYRIPAVVSVLAVTQATGAIYNAMIMKSARKFSLLPEKPFRVSNFVIGGPLYTVLSTKRYQIWAGGSALCDVVIAYFMTVYLWKRRSGAMETTQIAINRIIKLVLETGTVTALFAIILLALAMLPDHISYYQVPVSVLAKLYSNSMFALLNNRITLSTNTDMGSRPTVPRGRPLTVLKFVEAHQDPEILAADKPHDNDAGSLDERSVGSG